MLFYEVIRIKNGIIYFYSMNPFKKQLKFEIEKIEKITVFFNDFCRGIITICTTNNDTRKIGVDISSLEHKKLMKDLVETGLNVE